MAFIIKSDAAMRSGRGRPENIHGFHGPQDYHAMLDFTHEQYIVQGKQRKFDEVVGFQRGAEATYVDVLGREHIARGNEPRIHTLTERRERGLLLERSKSNGATGDEHGAPFSVDNSSYPLVLSWRGNGDVSLDTSSALTMIAEGQESGRKYKGFSRSSEVAGTIIVSGNVSDVLITNSGCASPYFPHQTDKAADIASLIGEAAAPLLAGTGTIVFRSALLPLIDGQTSVGFNVINSASPEGRLTLKAALAENSAKTASLSLVPDGGSARNDDIRVARVVGTSRETAITGMSFENNGESTGIMAYGQASFGTATAANVIPPAMLDQTKFGSSGQLITQCVVYDRMLSEQESFDVANFTLL